MENALTEIVVLFGAALLAAWLMRILRAPAILGFLIAGILIGPSGLNLIAQQDVHFFAELGLVLLLFVVGLELSVTPLVRSGPRLLLGAVLQLGVTALLGAVLLYAFGLAGLLPAVILGSAAAISSTPVMINYFSDRGQTDSPASVTSTIISLVQDIGSILVLVLLPLLARTTEDWSAALLKTGLAFAGLVGSFVLGRLLLPILVRWFTQNGRSRELMTLFAIVMACSGAWLAGEAGWSWGLGSFLAGLLLAQTDLRHQIRSEIMPFRNAFNAVFFISIGMLMQLSLFFEHTLVLIGAIIGLVVLKALIAGGAILVAGWPVRLAVIGGVALSTISEFGYILGQAARDLDLISPEMLSGLVACLVGSTVLGTLLLPLTPALSEAIDRRLDLPFGGKAPLPVPEHNTPLRSHVLIVGYGLNGRNLARVLRATRIPYSVVEMNPSNAGDARNDGALTVVGDATRLSILQQAGLDTARALVISVAELEPTRRIVAQVHAARPDLYIVTRTRYLSELDTLYQLGARQVIPEEFETSIEIFAHVLKEFGVPDNIIDQQIMLVRAGRYRMLRGLPTDPALRTEWLQILEAAVTQVFLLQAGSPAEGKTIRELDLRARTGATIVALTRSGQPFPAPQPEFRLEAGDVLVLVGRHKQLDEARRMLEAPPEYEASPATTVT